VAAIVKVCVLASSSAGNSIYVAGARTRILIDAGLSRKETLARLAAIGEDGDRMDAILITHEHSDHIAGLPVLARHTGAPVFLTHQTAPLIDWRGAVPAVECFQAGARFDVGDITVQSFTVPHDAADPVGFALTVEGVRLGIVTDLGYLPDSVKHHVSGANFLLLESNHDVDMLKVGPYPWSLKQRVLSRKGHLSNDAAGAYIVEELPGEVHTLVLGHLSENNNLPALAELSARQALEVRAHGARLVVAEPRKQSEVFLF
jgi:phosphoribosyl 1,2-cyclic phosphodiesterase